MGWVVHGARCPWGELSVGQIVRGANCPWGGMSVGRNVRGAKCPWGELSVGRIVRGAKCPWGEMSVGWDVVGRVINNIHSDYYCYTYIQLVSFNHSKHSTVGGLIMARFAEIHVWENWRCSLHRLDRVEWFFSSTSWDTYVDVKVEINNLSLKGRLPEMPKVGLNWKVDFSP
jgi:hypothetical protein